MYPIALAIHGIVRWVVLVLAVVAVVRAFVGWVAKGEWKAADNKSGSL